MKRMIINGHEIVTNYGGSYSLGDGNDTKTKRVEVMHPKESTLDFVTRLANAGYTNITLKLATTCIRGYNTLYALVK